jgi:hypothetical protein
METTELEFSPGLYGDHRTRVITSTRGHRTIDFSPGVGITELEFSPELKTTELELWTKELELSSALVSKEL